MVLIVEGTCIQDGSLLGLCNIRPYELPEYTLTKQLPGFRDSFHVSMVKQTVEFFPLGGQGRQSIRLPCWREEANCWLISDHIAT